MQKLVNSIDKLTERIGGVISWLTLIMMLTMVTTVVLRYGFHVGSIAAQESVMYLHAAVFMVAAGYTLKADEHVRVDIFYRNFTPRGKALVDLTGSLLLLTPICLFLLIMSFDYVMVSWQRQEGSADAGGLAWVYLLKTLLLIMPALLLLQGLAEASRNILILRGQLELTVHGEGPGV